MNDEKNTGGNAEEPNVANSSGSSSSSVVGGSGGGGDVDTTKVVRGDQTPTTFVEDVLTLEEEVAQHAPFVLDAPHYDLTVVEDGIEYVHRVRQPDRSVEDLLSRMSKIVTTTKRIKVDDEPATQISTKQHTGKARKRYFDGVAMTVSGYDINDDGKADADVDVQNTIEVDRELYEELVAQKVIKAGDAVRVLHVVPDTHKLNVADQLFGGSFTIVQPKQKVVRSLRGRRRILVLQKTGVRTLEDGSESDPTHMILWEYTEPSGEAVDKWETDGFNSSTIVLQDGTSREERTVNLETYEELFDAHCKRIVGAGFATSFNGTGASGDVAAVDLSNPKHKKKVPVSLKKTVTMFVFNHVKQSVGN